jgi:hypothetical protein
VVVNTLRTEGLQRIDKAIPTASAAECEGDHSSTPYEPTFQ